MSSIFHVFDGSAKQVHCALLCVRDSTRLLRACGDCARAQRNVIRLGAPENRDVHAKREERRLQTARNDAALVRQRTARCTGAR